MPSDVPNDILLPIVECHLVEACLGGPSPLCGDGYSGRRCGQCSAGYYKMSSGCMQCTSAAYTLILLFVLVLAVLLLIGFFTWQTMRDPRIGNPIVMVMRLLETLGIFAVCTVRWPGSIPVFLSITSLVNLNTEVFQIECLLGPPHPARAALMYVIGIAVLLLVLLLFYPLLQLRKRCVHYDRGESPSLESMCEMLTPGKAATGTGLPFTPMQALMASTFKEYFKIALTVPALPNASPGPGDRVALSR